MKLGFKGIKKWLSGKKTYLAVLVGLLVQANVISGEQAKAVTDILGMLPAMAGDPTTWGLLGLGALRAGVTKSGPPANGLG